MIGEFAMSDAKAPINTSTESVETSTNMNDLSQNDRIRVMIVDDSRLSRMSLKTTLNGASDKVLCVAEAGDGAEALKLIGIHRPQIVLMDIGMPIMDGIRATWAVKKSYPDTQVIMLTSHESEQDVLEAFQAGAHSYCLKETSPAMLIHVILSTAHGACWIDPQIARIVMTRMQPSASPWGGNSQQPSPFPTEDAIGYPSLTDRELEALKLITEGRNNAEIASELGISLNTVKTHLKNIFQKLGVEDRTSAALKALKDRII
jgi:DNA-binding NarL/FixJ family response regulator